MHWAGWLSLVFAAVDVLSSTAVFCRGNFDVVWIREQFAAYTAVDVSDVWVGGLFRSSFVVLLLAFFLWARHKSKGAAEWLPTVNLMVQSILGTALMAKAATLTCFEDLVTEGGQWRWGMVAHGCGMCLVDYLVLQAFLDSPLPEPAAPPPAETLRTKLLTPSTSQESLVSEASSHSGEEGEGEGEGEGEEGGVVAEMGKKFSKIKEKRAVLWRLLILALPEWQYLSGGFSFLLIAAATTTWLPKLTGEVIDDIVIEKNEDLIRGSLTRLAVVSLASAVASGIRGTCFLIIMVKMNVRLRDKVYSAILCQEMDFFDATKTGDLSSRLSADCNKMSDQIGLNINVFLRSVVQAIGLLCFMVYSQWQLTVVTFLSVPLVTVVSRVYGSYYRTIAESVQDQQAACNAAAEEIIGSMRTVRSFGNEEREREEYRAKLDKLVALGFSQAYAYTGYMSFVSASPLLVTVAVLFYGGHMVMVGSLKPGELISFVFYQQSLSQALGSIGDVFTGLMQAAGAAEKVFDIMDRKPKIAPEGTLAPETLRGEIEFDNVSMVYSARAETIVLDKVSFSVAAGQVAALVGSSGSGKSSCIALLQRFYQASGGRVLLDGHPLEAYTHEYLHSRISLVAQEPVLYARSIAENIAYGFGEHLSPEELRAKVVEAAKLACCHHFISRMKLGYDTMAGEKGSHLSGGQKQRIAIARALVRDPAVLLLDEATSALDTASEASVQSAIDTSMQGRTVLVIAHRLSTVRRAHNIIVLQDGVVQQQGTHDSLIEQGGVYKTLVQRQLGPEHIDAQEMSSAQLIT